MPKYVNDLENTETSLINRRISESDKLVKNIVYDDEYEKEYYLEVIESVEKQSKYHLTGWHHWETNYSFVDWNRLLKEPYFGSVKEVGASNRIYIGKQKYYDISKSCLYVFDWRSSFGDLYYRRKKHSFIEKRPVEIESIREYNKYSYNEMLNEEYEGFLKQVLKEKKSGFLEDVIQTIDEAQNDILRSINYRIEIIEGGPGTGKTTLGLHILSYKIYDYTKKSREYPRLLILVEHLEFKDYIYNLLVSLDLIGKNYHNTKVLTHMEYSKESEFFDFIFVDEAQELTTFLGEKLLNETQNSKLILSIDYNQKLNSNKTYDFLKYCQANSIKNRTRKLLKNYRNPYSVVKYINKLKKANQLPKNLNNNKVYFYLKNDILNWKRVIIHFIKERISEETAIIVDSWNIGLIELLLTSENINFSKNLKFDFSCDIKIFVLTYEMCKGFEFDNIICVKDNTLDNREKYSTELYVGVSRSIGDVLVISNDELIQFNSEYYIFADNEVDLFYKLILISSRAILDNIFLGKRLDLIYYVKKLEEKDVEDFISNMQTIKADKYIKGNIEDYYPYVSSKFIEDIMRRDEKCIPKIIPFLNENNKKIVKACEPFLQDIIKNELMTYQKLANVYNPEKILKVVKLNYNNNIYVSDKFFQGVSKKNQEIVKLNVNNLPYLLLQKLIINNIISYHDLINLNYDNESIYKILKENLMEYLNQSYQEYLVDMFQMIGINKIANYIRENDIRFLKDKKVYKYLKDNHKILKVHIYRIFLYSGLLDIEMYIILGYSKGVKDSDYYSNECFKYLLEGKYVLESDIARVFQNINVKRQIRIYAIAKLKVFKYMKLNKYTKTILKPKI